MWNDGCFAVFCYWHCKIEILFYLPRCVLILFNREVYPKLWIVLYELSKIEMHHVQPTSIHHRCPCRETNLSPNLGYKHPIFLHPPSSPPPKPREKLCSVPELQMWAPGQSTAQTWWTDRESFPSAAPLLGHPDKCCGWEVWEEKLSPRHMKRWLKLFLTFPINGKIKPFTAETVARAMWLVCVFSVS